MQKRKRAEKKRSDEIGKGERAEKETSGMVSKVRKSWDRYK